MSYELEKRYMPPPCRLLYCLVWRVEPGQERLLRSRELRRQQGRQPARQVLVEQEAHAAGLTICPAA